MSGPGPVDGHDRGPGARPWSDAEFRAALDPRLVRAALLGEAPLWAAVVGTGRGALQVAAGQLEAWPVGADGIDAARAALRQAVAAAEFGAGYDLIGYERQDRYGVADVYQRVARTLEVVAAAAEGDLARRDVAVASVRIDAVLRYCAEVLDPMTAAVMSTIPDGVTADAS